MTTNVQVEDKVLDGTFNGPVTVELRSDMAVGGIDDLAEFKQDIKEMNDASLAEAKGSVDASKKYAADSKQYSLDSLEYSLDAENSATAAEASAIKAKAEADRATEVSGLDTVEDAVALALSNAYMYARTKAEYRASMIDNESIYAGSGFVDMGLHSTLSVNQGLWVPPNARTLNLGRSGISTINDGISDRAYATAHVNGHFLHLQGMDAPSHNAITIPISPAEKGTKRYINSLARARDYSTEIDPKYGDVAGSEFEAISRAYEGELRNGNFRLGSDGLQGWVTATTNGVSRGTAVKGPRGMVVTDTTGLEVSSACMGIFSDDIEIAPGTYDLEITISDISSPDVAMVRTGHYSLDNRQTLHKGVNRIPITVVEGAADRAAVFLIYVGNLGSVTVSSVSVMPSSDKFLTSRKDYVALEVWEEDVSAKGVLVPLGNVQWTQSSWGTFGLARLSTLGVKQTYSAYGDWDKSTSGYGMSIASLSSNQLERFIADPRNNIYYDNDNNKLVQVRYRFRYINGLGNNWRVQIPYEGAGQLAPEAGNICVMSRGLRDDFTELGTPVSGFKYVNDKPLMLNESKAGRFVNRIPSEYVSYSGYTYLLPIATIQRMTRSAYHPELNPSGTCMFRSAAGYGAPWYHSSIPEWAYPSSTIDCYDTRKIGSSAGDATVLAPMSSDRGSIDDTYSGRQDPLMFHDAVFNSQVMDLRLSAIRKDTDKLQNEVLKAALTGTMRGEEGLAFHDVRFTYGLELASSRTLLSYNETSGHNLLGDNGGFILHKGEAYRLRTYSSNNYWVVVSKWVEGEWVDGKWLKELNIRSKSESTEANSMVFSYPFIASGSSMAGGGGKGYTGLPYVVPRDTSTFDVLPNINLCGNPKVLAEKYPGGFPGEWIPTQVDGVSTTIQLTRKLDNTSFSRLISAEGNAYTFGVISLTSESNNSLTTSAPSVGGTVILFPQTITAFSEPDSAARPLITDPGKLMFSDAYSASSGNRAMHSMTGKYNVGTQHPAYGITGLESYAIHRTGYLRTEAELAPRHGWLNHKSSDTGIKTLVSLVEKDGLIYAQFNGCELRAKLQEPLLMDGTSTESVDITKYQQYYVVGGPLGGKVVTALTTGTFTPSRYIEQNGQVVFLETGVASSNVAISSMDGWGDDKTLPIVTGEGTKTDLNGDMVKTFCHISKHPVGIAYQKDTEHI